MTTPEVIRPRGLPGRGTGVGGLAGGSAGLVQADGGAVNRSVAAATRDAVFLSYSHDDQDWRGKFTVMLEPDVRNHGLGGDLYQRM